MLAARPQLDPGLLGPGGDRRDAEQFADPGLVEYFEGVGGQDAVCLIRREQLRLDVITAERIGHLGQVVGAEREEVGVFRQGSGSECSPRRFDHGADGHDVRGQLRMADPVEHAGHPAAGQPQLLGVDDERNHHLDVGGLAALEQVGGSRAQSADLHLVHAAADDAEPHAACADHRVRLVEASYRCEFDLLVGTQLVARLAGGQVE